MARTIAVWVASDFKPVRGNTSKAIVPATAPPKGASKQLPGFRLVRQLYCRTSAPQVDHAANFKDDNTRALRFDCRS